MKWRCLYGHKWSEPHNYRPHALAQIISSFVRVNVALPYLYDKTCVRCGKVRTFECAKPTGQQ